MLSFLSILAQEPPEGREDFAAQLGADATATPAVRGDEFEALGAVQVVLVGRVIAGVADEVVHVPGRLVLGQHGQGDLDVVKLRIGGAVEAGASGFVDIRRLFHTSSIQDDRTPVKRLVSPAETKIKTRPNFNTS